MIDGVSVQEVIVIGGGLAGVEAAWQIAQRGIRVCLCEMRPAKMTPAHTTDRLAELVCSNSLGADQPDKAPGLLKQEMRLLGSLVLACAEQAAVPAGSALAVDRERFAQRVTEQITAHPLITVIRQEVTRIPDGDRDRQRPAYLRRAGRRDRPPGRHRPPLLLGRHRPDRDRGFD